MKWIRALGVALCVTSSGMAEVSVSDFTIGVDFVSFSISGTFPPPTPSANEDVLFVTHPQVIAEPGFVVVDFVPVSSQSFSGPQMLLTPWGVAAVGGVFGDHIFLTFDDTFTVEQQIDADFSAF